MDFMLWKLLHDAVATCLYRTHIGRLTQIMDVSKMESICLGCGMLLKLSLLPVWDTVRSPVRVPIASQWDFCLVACCRGWAAFGS